MTLSCGGSEPMSWHASRYCVGRCTMRTRAGARSGAVLSGRKYVNSVSRSLCASNSSATCVRFAAVSAQPWHLAAHAKRCQMHEIDRSLVNYGQCVP